jgi:hypothetical protein
MDLQQKFLIISKEYVFKWKSTISEYLNTGRLTWNTNLHHPSIIFIVSHVVVSLMMACPKHLYLWEHMDGYYLKQNSQDTQLQWISWNLMLCSWIKITQQWSLDRLVPDSHYSTSCRNDEILQHYTRLQYSTNDDPPEHLALADTSLSPL